MRSAAPRRPPTVLASYGGCPHRPVRPRAGGGAGPGQPRPGTHRRFYKQLGFAGVQVVTLPEGDIRNCMSASRARYPRCSLRTSHKIPIAALKGRVRSGRSGGGLSYGTESRGGSGRMARRCRREWRSLPTEQATVRRIFHAYADGRSPRSIAKGLNAEGVPGPRSGKWTASLILGNARARERPPAQPLVCRRARLEPPTLHQGPDTGRRVARPNPREAWIITAGPATVGIIDRRSLGSGAERRLQGWAAAGRARPDNSADRSAPATRLPATRRPPCARAPTRLAAPAGCAAAPATAR